MTVITNTSMEITTMSTIKLRHYGDPVRVRTQDAAFKDTLIGTDTIINAEPSPPMPDMGTRQLGTSTVKGAPRPVDVDVIWSGIKKGIESLDAGDLAKIKAIMKKYGNDEGVNGAGISSGSIASTDADVVRSMSEKNAAFWNARFAAQ
jgi:hypothetical protein